MKKFLATIFATIAADQFVKWFMLVKVGIAERPAIEVTSFFRLVMVWNKGVSFGMFNRSETGSGILILVAIVISAWLFKLARETHSSFERLAYGLIIGGALANVIDRLRFGYVADFFYFHLGDLGWPAFNIADSAICLGVIALLLRIVKHPAKS